LLRSTPSRLAASLALLLGIALFTGPAAGQSDSPRQAQSFKEKAKEAEKRGAWLDACRFYEDLVRTSRGEQREEYQKAYQRCLRRLHLFARNSDPAYRQTVARTPFPKALNAFEEIVRTLNLAYPDRSRSDLPQLFQAGLKEMETALEDPVFKKHYLADVKPAALTVFKQRVATWPTDKFTSTKEMREQLRVLIGRGKEDGLPVGGPLGSALVMEAAAGACNSLDEYSSFLTPTHLALMQGPRKTTGLGLNLVSDQPNSKYPRVSKVYSGGPADKQLLENDLILSIDGKSVEGMAVGTVEAKLRGEADKPVEIEYQRGRIKKTIELTFREVRLPSVESSVLDDSAEPVGYVCINYFNEETFRDVKDALNRMTARAPIKGLILDLRGNPGGLFLAAVQVAELFLSGGIISIGQSAHPDFNRTFKVEAPGDVQLPMVVLVDGDTASAAEVLAAALKESRPGTHLLGQKTYGKGSIQCVIELKKVPLENKLAGIRLTVAKLFSPSNTPISGNGIEPHEKAGADAMQKAKDYLFDKIRALGMTGMPMMPSSGPSSEREPADTQQPVAP